MMREARRAFKRGNHQQHVASHRCEPAIDNAARKRAFNKVMRYLWALPTTLVGLAAIVGDRAIAAVHGLTRPAGARRAAADARALRVVQGVIEAHGPHIAWALTHLTFVRGGVAAMTLGHVVLARDAAVLEATRTHERVHVRQCERWGPLFVPAYLAASLLAYARGGDFYRDNWFEVEAFAAERRG